MQKLKIEDHRLVGEAVEHLETPNRYGWTMTPSGIVEHYTASATAGPAINWLMNPEADASAHLVIGRDGSITQLAPFNVPTWHAGDGRLPDGSNPNLSTIGIEFVNVGWLNRDGNGNWRSWSGVPILSVSVFLDDRGRGWQEWTDTEIEVGLAVHRLLLATYPIAFLTGHEHVSPRRKVDPGPAFPWRRFMALDGRADAKLAFPGEPFPGAAPRTLRLGSRGTDVAAVQLQINEFALGPQLIVDGVFGPRTDRAVRTFQEQHGLVADGIVGPATRAALGRVALG